MRISPSPGLVSTRLAEALATSVAEPKRRRSRRRLGLGHVAALFGANGPLTTPPGWLNANLYANFVPLIVLLLTIGYGAACLAGQDENGTLGLIASLPVSRRRIAAQKFASLSL